MSGRAWGGLGWSSLGRCEGRWRLPVGALNRRVGAHHLFVQAGVLTVQEGEEGLFFFSRLTLVNSSPAGMSDVVVAAAA